MLRCSNTLQDGNILSQHFIPVLDSASLANTLCIEDCFYDSVVKILG